MSEPYLDPLNKGEECSFIEKKEGIGSHYKQRVHWSQLGVGSIMASHWLRCDCPSLAGLLPGEELRHFPHAGIAQ